ncbi:MAG: hypothetical protein P8J86_07160 [Phycisphaerales bacterium]|nr:hypothetical protein [Phycisphaerales bacterium]
MEAEEQIKAWSGCADYHPVQYEAFTRIRSKFTMASTHRDLVLGRVRSIDIAPFYVSLAKSGYRRQVVFADDLSEQTINALVGGGIEVHRLKSWQLISPFRNRKIQTYRLMYPHGATEAAKIESLNRVR